MVAVVNPVRPLPVPDPPSPPLPLAEKLSSLSRSRELFRLSWLVRGGAIPPSRGSGDAIVGVDGDSAGEVRLSFLLGGVVFVRTSPMGVSVGESVVGEPIEDDIELRVP